MVSTSLKMSNILGKLTKNGKTKIDKKENTLVEHIWLIFSNLPDGLLCHSVVEDLEVGEEAVGETVLEEAAMEEEVSIKVVETLTKALQNKLYP